MKNRLFHALVIALMLLVPAGTALAQEAAAEESTIGFGPMIAILGMGLLAVLTVGLIMNSRDSADEAETE